MSAPLRRQHPHEDTFFDKIEVERIERYKTSGMSGDEWRFSWRIRCIRRGRVLVQRWCNGHDYAMLLAATAMAIGWEIVGFHESHPEWQIVEPWDDGIEKGICCQPGCPIKATVHYRMKREYDRSCFFSKDLEDDQLWYREFCEKHKRRGDSGLDDGEGNYELMEDLQK